MNRINGVIESLSNIVYGKQNALNATEMLELAMATVRDEEGLHEIFYSEVGSRDVLVRSITTIHDGFVRKGVCDWSPVILSFEENTGIDFYTLISFILLTQQKSTASAAELNTVVIVASILAKYNRVNAIMQYSTSEL